MLKIYNYIQMPDLPFNTPPKGLDFKKGLTTKLGYAEDVVKGLILKETYSNPEDETDIILVVDHTYNLDMNTGLYTSVYTKISYYLEDGTISADVKDFTKKLTARQQLKLAKQRRDTVRNIAEAKTLGLLLQVMADKTPQEIMALGGGFLVTYNTELDIYVKSGSTYSLFTKLDADTTSWLDIVIAADGTKVRDFIKAEFL